MTSSSPSHASHHRRRRARHAMGWIALSMFLHAIALGWLERHMQYGVHPELPASIEAIVLAPPPTPSQSSPVISRPAPSRPKPVAIKPTPALPPPEPVVPSEQQVASPPAAEESLAADTEQPADSSTNKEHAPVNSSGLGTGAREGNVEQMGQPVSPGRPLDAHDLPPPGTAQYDAEGRMKNGVFYGNGRIRFLRDGARYRIEQQATLNLLMFELKLQNATSDGDITATGLAPSRYVEQVRNRAPVATNFNRAPGQNTITFSASTREFPLAAGTQDRISVLLQLAGWLRSNPGRIAPGDQLTVVLAGTRSVEPWVFQTIGEESVSTRAGTFAAWHFQRPPRPDSNDPRIDIWLSAQVAWYPVRIVYTERNGNTVDLVLRGFQQE
ncbi:MAG TPA: DUF3108 domain-containing protein [Burkholderiaceae bacterium]|nr:DUF3108 domain-containing protein [Burkholderiaceae bacterium]